MYDSSGAVLIEQTLGDGIKHVLTTRRGEIWVGYFDEGVYGSYGWGVSDTEPPLGACGLTRFSAALTEVWRYPSHVDNEWGVIDDCYALNVDGDTAWTCYYTNFPIVRIRHPSPLRSRHRPLGVPQVRDRLVAITDVKGSQALTSLIRPGVSP